MAGCQGAGPESDLTTADVIVTSRLTHIFIFFFVCSDQPCLHTCSYLLALLDDFDLGVRGHRQLSSGRFEVT